METASGAPSTAAEVDSGGLTSTHLGVQDGDPVLRQHRPHRRPSRGGIESYYYDQLGSAYSDQPDDDDLWQLDRFADCSPSSTPSRTSAN